MFDFKVFFKSVKRSKLKLSETVGASTRTVSSPVWRPAEQLVMSQLSRLWCELVEAPPPLVCLCVCVCLCVGVSSQHINSVQIYTVFYNNV